MIVNLFSKSKILDTVRYFVRPISDRKLIVSENYDQLNITDLFCNKIKMLDIESGELITHNYFSDDKKHFLWNSEGNDLNYIYLDVQDLKQKKLVIPENLSLIQYYVWDEDKFIIVGIENGVSDRILFFSYDVFTHTLNEISYSYIKEKYSFFKAIFECAAVNYLLYYNVKKEMLIYKKGVGGREKVFFQDLLGLKKIELPFADKDVHTADYLDDVLVLVHKDYVAFYYAGVESYRLEMDKRGWAFRSAHFFKHNNNFYCLVTQFDLCQPKRNIIEVYQIEE